MADDLGKYKFVDNTPQAEKAMDEAVIKCLTAIGMFLESEAKEELGNDPIRIDTGYLRNSITWGISGKNVSGENYESNSSHRVSGAAVKPKKTGSYKGTLPDDKEKAVYIGTNVNYAVTIHEGSIGMSANKFIKNAVTKNEDQIKEYIKKEFKEH